jgi:hypothetical protein
MSNYESGDSRRRDIEATTTVAKALKARKERLRQPPAVKPTYKRLSTEGQLERSIHLTNLALNKYEVKLEDGDELTGEEERVFMSLLDTIRKTEATLAGIQAKAKTDDMGPVEIALGLVDTGMDIDDVLAMYPNNKAVGAALEKRR